MGGAGGAEEGSSAVGCPGGHCGLVSSGGVIVVEAFVEWLQGLSLQELSELSAEELSAAEEAALSAELSARWRVVRFLCGFRVS